jgi:asparagine synthase (glutamine-hydrolysing)
MLETSLHLYQPPRYARLQKKWFEDCSQAFSEGDQKLTLDASAILSILAFNFPCGDRTLFQEIKRQPWLSTILKDGTVSCEKIPPHGFLWDKTEGVAKRLNYLLQEEATRVCHNRDEIYILLSGGLDSRIVAGVLYQIKAKGRLKTDPVCLTWGLENSRDVQYAKATADMLGFGWKHIAISPESIIENICEGFPLIGGLVPPAHLHSMLWFKNNVGKEAIVLAGSYGDSVGRAEFSGRHLLELDFLRPYNPFNLIRQDCLPHSIEGIQDDLSSLHARAGNDGPKYVLCEIERQCYYMRGMIAHAMAVINKWCTLYQMFTDPDVYTYVWSLHPSRRDNSIYAALLERIHPGLARLPWARTNRALRGRTVGSKKGLRQSFRDYDHWASNELYSEISGIVDPEWYESTGIFNANQIRILNNAIAGGPDLLKDYGFKPYDIWLWLAGFRKMIEKLQEQGCDVHVIRKKELQEYPLFYFGKNTSLRSRLGHIKALRGSVRNIKKLGARIEALKKWPVTK